MEDIDPLLAASRALPDFKRDVVAYGRHDSERIVTTGRPPRVKVLRVLAQLLYAEPALPIASVMVRGNPGCCDFRGEITAHAEGISRTWDFVWDCRWRARQEGLHDYLGFPDQARAAREFGWRCFATWSERARD
jgi:hypothetical protein